MKNRWVAFVAGWILVFNSGALGLAQKKLTYATPVRAPHFGLPMMAAEEKGFWKQSGLEVKWIALEWGRGLSPAFAAGAVEMAIADALSPILGIARGGVEIIVADLAYKENYHIWVRADSKMKHPEDLAGIKLGVPSFGTSPAAYARLMGKAIGLKKEMKPIALGGLGPRIAALKAGVIDAVVLTIIPVANQAALGEFRSVSSLKGFLPKTWLGVVAIAQSRFGEKNPDMVKETIRATLLATDFCMKNPDWVKQKLISEFGYKAKASELVLTELSYGKGGKVERKLLEDLIGFAVEYGLVRMEEVPPMERLFTNRFID